MTKFKVGDRVRRVCNVHMGMRPGDEATVTKVTKYRHVELDGYAGQHSDNSLEFVNDNTPIRTITRREIVPGVYGAVRIHDAETASVYDLNNAASVRSAARIFNEIADVLEENA